MILLSYSITFLLTSLAYSNFLLNSSFYIRHDLITSFSLYIYWLNSATLFSYSEIFRFISLRSWILLLNSSFYLWKLLFCCSKNPNFDFQFDDIYLSKLSIFILKFSFYLYVFFDLNSQFPPYSILFFNKVFNLSFYCIIIGVLV